MHFESQFLSQIQSWLALEQVNHPQFGTIHSEGQIGTAGFLLGLICASHATLWFTMNTFLNESQYTDFTYAVYIWCEYVALLSLFHFLEFFITAVYQPRHLSYNSYVINHSEGYTVAAVVSWIEYWLEFMLFGRRKYFRIVNFVGLLMVIGGQIIRSLAMRDCGESFSHIIAVSKDSTHTLRTEGIYSYLRHPSYFGWFYWSVGTQLILCNPLCIIAYAIVSWKFFAGRIPFEENTLVKFYGNEYREYARKTPIGIPFISTNSATSKDE